MPPPRWMSRDRRGRGHAMNCRQIGARSMPPASLTASCCSLRRYHQIEAASSIMTPCFFISAGFLSSGESAAWLAASLRVIRRGSCSVIVAAVSYYASGAGIYSAPGGVSPSSPDRSVSADAMPLTTAPQSRRVDATASCRASCRRLHPFSIARA